MGNNNDDDTGADQPMDHHSHRIGGRVRGEEEKDDDDEAVAPPVATGGANVEQDTAGVAAVAAATPRPSSPSNTTNKTTESNNKVNDSMIIGKKKNATNLLDELEDDEHSLIGDTPHTKESLHMNRSTTGDMKLKQQLKKERDQQLQQQQEQQQQQQDQEKKQQLETNVREGDRLSNTKDNTTTTKENDRSITEDMKLKQLIKDERDQLNNIEKEEDPIYRKCNQAEREDTSSWQPTPDNNNSEKKLAASVVVASASVTNSATSGNAAIVKDIKTAIGGSSSQQPSSPGAVHVAGISNTTTVHTANNNNNTEKDLADITTAIDGSSQSRTSSAAAPGAVHVAGINSSTTTTANHSQEEVEECQDFDGQQVAINNTNGHGGGGGTGGETTDDDDYESLGDVPSLVDPSVVETVITAITVEDQEKHLEEKQAQMEEQLREKIIQEAVEADVVCEADLTAALQDASARSHNKTPRRKKCLMILLIAVCVAVAIIGGIAIGLSLDQNDNNDSDSATTLAEDEEDTNLPTIDIVRKRGYVRCGTYDGRYGFGKLNFDTGIIEGINIDQCRAVAMAVFDDPSRYEPIVITSKNRLPMLANGSIDVLTNTVTYTMNRDVYDKPSDTGFAFSTPYLYSGLAFGGVPTFVDCADDLETFYGDCRHLKICAGFGTTHYFMLMDMLPGSVVVSANSPKEQADFFIDGTCNVVAVEPVSLLETLLREYGYEGPFKAGSKLFSKEPLSLVTREDDPQWSNLVDLIVNIFYLAEAENITKATAPHSFGDLFPDDPDIAAIAVAIVSEFGNYGDLYREHLEPIFPRGGINTIYKAGDDTGLLYSFPFGYLGAKGPGPIPNMTLSKIMDRGSLRCGVIPRPGFAELNDEGNWFGFDVEFCHGIAGAVFFGASELVEFVNVTRDSSYAYSALAKGEVDTIAGARVTLQAKYREPTTNKGIAFSPSTFYDNKTWDSFAFATNEEDHQWSDFVHWVISATIYAEEEGITQKASAEMPVTSLFGDDLKQMLRDTVNAVGNFGEIYNRTLEDVAPRSGPNMPNANLSGAQQYPLQVA